MSQARSNVYKLRDIVNVKDPAFGAKGDGTTDDSAAIQAAIDAVSAANGGTVFFPTGRYNLGTTGITTYSNVRLLGSAQAYVGATRGVEFLYSGTGPAIIGTNLLNSDIENASIDATNATGASQRGIYLKGAWLCTLRNVRVKGIAAADGYSILVDTNTGGPTWGAQHNYFEKLECSDGTIRLAGSASNDAVTTTVINTCRGKNYESEYASVVFLNCTAEGFTANGFKFANFNRSLMIGCDIEGTGTPGILLSGSDNVVRELGTIWAGFSGATKVSGNLSAWEVYGGGHAYIDNPSLGALFNNVLAWSNANATFARAAVRANNITGGTQDGHFELLRRIAGTEYTTHELKRSFHVEHIKSVNNVAVTILTIPIATNGGAYVKTVMRGLETAAGPFTVMRETVVVSNAGTLAKTDGTALSINTGGATGAITYTISGTNLLVQASNGHATGVNADFEIVIEGEITGFTKG